MTSIIELLIVLLSSFGLGMIPFAGPSNMIIAFNWAVGLGSTDLITLVTIGFLVALGASCAKSIHYLATFFVSKHLSEKRQHSLDKSAKRVQKWAFLLLFAAAATPIPDEPIVIPLGLMKYNPVKFFSAFFFGKLSITVVGAFLGAWTGETLSEFASPEVTIAISIALTVFITVILLKVDLGKLIEKILAIFGRKNHEAVKDS